MTHDVILRDRDALLVQSKRLPVTMPEIAGVLGRSLGEVYAYLAATGIATPAEPFVIYHDVPTLETPFDIEICVPVERASDPLEGWRIQELPAGSFVSLLHVGPYEELGAAYRTLEEWISTHRLAYAGPPREVYLSEPGTAPGEVRTVVEFPVVEIAAAVASS